MCCPKMNQRKKINKTLNCTNNNVLVSNFHNSKYYLTLNFSIVFMKLLHSIFTQNKFEIKALLSVKQLIFNSVNMHLYLLLKYALNKNKASVL